MKISEALLEAAQVQHDTTTAQVLVAIAEVFQKIEETAAASAENPTA